MSQSTTSTKKSSPSSRSVRSWNSGPGEATREYLVLGVGLVVLFLLPLLLPTSYQPVMVKILIFAIMAVGWNIMSGYGGMFSFGHAAFFGIGAYSVAYLLSAHGLNPWFGMLFGAMLAAIVGTVFAFLCLRYKLEGSYFGLATFAFAQMFFLLTENLEFLNRTEGINIPILQDDSWLMMQFHPTSYNYYWIGLFLLVAAVAVSIWFVHSRPGRFTTAIRDDEVAAESLGIAVLRHRLITVALSCAITAIAGGFYTQYYMFVGPNQGFGMQVSVDAIVPAVIGGVGTIWGPLIGAVVVGGLSEAIADLVRNPPAGLEFLQGLSGLDVAIYAILLIIIVVFLPKGIYGTIRERLRK